MAEKTLEGTWRCTICGKEFRNAEQADHCRNQHDIVLVTFLKSDLKHLITFLYSKDDDDLTPTLVQTLMKYNVLDVK